MAVVDFNCLCSTYPLCSFSPIVSIFLILLTTVSSSISSESNASRYYALSSRNGFPISSIEVTNALTCLFVESLLHCRNLFVVSNRTFTMVSYECALKLC